MELIGDLDLEYHSVAGFSFDIPKVGEYSYNITAHRVYLLIENAGGEAVGLYKVTTFKRSPITNQIGFELFLVYSLLAFFTLVYITKRT